VVGRLGGGHVGLGLGVDGGALVGHLGDVPVDVVGGVLDVLDAAVGEGDGVGAGDDTVGVAGLGGVEVGLAVVVGDTVGVGVGLRGLLHVDNGGGVVSRGGNLDHRGRGVGGGSVDHRGNNSRGVVGRGSVDNGGSVVGRGGMVDNRGGVVCRGSVDNGGSMVGGSNNCVANTMVGTVDSSMVNSVDSVDSSLTKVGSNTVGGSVGN